MNYYRIVSEAGIDLGTYQGYTEEDAVRAMNRDAGYSTDTEALLVTGQKDIMDGLTVEEIVGNTEK